MDDEDLAVAVGVRMGVDVGRLAVRRPTRVSNAELARRHVGLQFLDQSVNLRLGLGHARADRLAGTGQLEDGYARRVIPAVLEALQALHEDRRRFTAAEVTDDPAHSLYL